MAVKHVEHKPVENRWMELGRKALLAYVGAFGVAADKFAEWFEVFADRGEEMEVEARKMMNRNEKQVRHLVQRAEAERNHAVKNVKKTVKKVEAAV